MTFKPLSMNNTLLCAAAGMALASFIGAAQSAQAGPICEITVRQQAAELRPLLDKITYEFKSLDMDGIEQSERQIEAMDDRQDMVLRRRGCLTPAGRLINVSQSTKQAEVSEMKGYLDRWVSILRGHGMTQYELNEMIREAKADTVAHYGFAW